MLIAIVHFPPIREGKEKEFLEWFSWSNKEFEKSAGFVGRRLLKGVGGSAYASIVEYESMDAFQAMQRSPIHGEAGARVQPLLEGGPTPEFFEVVEL